MAIDLFDGGGVRGYSELQAHQAVGGPALHFTLGDLAVVVVVDGLSDRREEIVPTGTHPEFRRIYETVVVAVESPKGREIATCADPFAFGDDAVAIVIARIHDGVHVNGGDLFPGEGGIPGHFRR